MLSKEGKVLDGTLDEMAVDGVNELQTVLDKLDSAIAKATRVPIEEIKEVASVR